MELAASAARRGGLDYSLQGKSAVEPNQKTVAAPFSSRSVEMRIICTSPAPLGLPGHLFDLASRPA